MPIYSTAVKFTIVVLLIMIFAGCNSKTSHNNQTGKAKEKNFFTVALLPYDNFDTALINFVQKEVGQFYNCKVTLLTNVTTPSFAFYPLRNRYKADSLLQYESTLLNAGIDAIAGLTSKDISTSLKDKPDWGIFGLGLCPGKVCVISDYRLQRASATLPQLKERLIKVVLHELGHNLGLPHCTNNSECLMTDAGGSIKQVDREKKWLCDSCQFNMNG
jgi:archaemetzincin